MALHESRIKGRRRPGAGCDEQPARQAISFRRTEFRRRIEVRIEGPKTVYVDATVCWNESRIPSLPPAKPFNPREFP